MGFPGILQKLFSNGGKGGTLRPEIVPDIEPRGVVKMWYGEAAKVPAGWAICDGTQGTPDLRDRFAIGAGGKYGLEATGGAESATPEVSLGTAKTGIKLANAAPGGTTDSTETGIVFFNATVDLLMGEARTGIGIQATTLDGNTLPSHTHSIITCADNGTSNSYPMGPGDTQRKQTNRTEAAGNSWGHTHGVTDPGHTHSVTSLDHTHDILDSGHTHTVTTKAHTHTLTDGGHSHTVTAKALSTLSPYCALYYIMKL
ncbi:hypothetical protein [Bilophila wadsworthia]|uniref:hypothetical protein n=1 Tax=Bilophila wadsworthia TaxID=35833 RepID=UPI00304F9F12